MRTNSKGLSPMIATVILFIIGVSAGLIAFTVTITYLGVDTSNHNSGQVSFGLIFVKGDAQNSNITMYLENTGTKAETLSQIYVNGYLCTNDNASLAIPNNAQTWSFVVNGNNQVELASGSTGVLSINSSGFMNPLISTPVKVYCEDGTVNSTNVMRSQ